jgi:hypothetical protein
MSHAESQFGFERKKIMHWSYNPAMEDFHQEDWVALYQSALVELEQAKMSGRIEAAKGAIVARMERLCTMPGLHPQERQAIEDALRSLRLLKQEEERFDAEEGRQAAERSLQNLRSVGATIQRFRQSADSE